MKEIGMTTFVLNYELRYLPNILWYCKYIVFFSKFQGIEVKSFEKGVILAMTFF
jgi:hypothetical protein